MLSIFFELTLTQAEHSIVLLRGLRCTLSIKSISQIVSYLFRFHNGLFDCYRAWNLGYLQKVKIKTWNRNAKAFHIRMASCEHEHIKYETKLSMAIFHCNVSAYRKLKQWEWQSFLFKYLMLFFYLIASRKNDGKSFSSFEEFNRKDEKINTKLESNVNRLD